MDTYSPSYSINKTHIYHVSKHSSSHYGSLIDRGANGSLAGSDGEFWKGLVELSLSLALTTMTEFRQPLQVQSHLEMPGILVQLGHIQCT